MELFSQWFNRLAAAESSAFGIPPKYPKAEPGKRASTIQKDQKDAYAFSWSLSTRFAHYHEQWYETELRYGTPEAPLEPCME